MNNVLIYAGCLFAVLVVVFGLYFVFGRRTGLSTEEKSWRRSIAISVIRLGSGPIK